MSLLGVNSGPVTYPGGILSSPVSSGVGLCVWCTMVHTYAFVIVGFL